MEKTKHGKSTLLKFIYCTLYGASRNKNGKEISDYEKYMPWNGSEYSGKINYELDNIEKLIKRIQKYITKNYKKFIKYLV